VALYLGVSELSKTTRPYPKASGKISEDVPNFFRVRGEFGGNNIVVLHRRFFSCTGLSLHIFRKCLFEC